MQTSGLIILGTTIAIVAIISEGQFLKGDGNGVCHVTVTRGRYGSGDYESWIEPRCCEGYEQRRYNCVPRCSPQCKNGHCAKPNECRCDPGWSGENCDSPRWCFVILNSTTTISKLPDAVPNEDALRRETEWTGSECLPECRDQVSNLPINVAESWSMKYYHLPIESPCNIKAVSQNILVIYKYQIIGIVGIGSLIIIVVCIMTLCLVRRNTTRNGSANLEFDFVNACNVRQPPEEQTRPESEQVYDNVAFFQRLPEEPTKPEEDYVNVCSVQQLPRKSTKPAADYVNVCIVRQPPEDQQSQPENEYVNVCNVQQLPVERTQTEYDYVDVGKVWQHR